MLCFLPHIANKSTVFPLTVKIRRGGALGHWRGQIYEQKSCFWFIRVVLMESAN